MSSRNKYEQLWDNEVVNFETQSSKGPNSTYQITENSIMRHSPGNRGRYDDQVDNDDVGKLMLYLKEDSIVVVNAARHHELKYLELKQENQVAYLFVKMEKGRGKMLAWNSNEEDPVAFYGYIHPKVGLTPFDFYIERNEDDQSVMVETHLGHAICKIEGVEGSNCCNVS